MEPFDPLWHRNNLLRHPDFRERERSADALRLARDVDSLPELRAALQDPSACVRLAAVSAISHLADAASVPALCMELQHPSWPIRAELAEVLGRLRDLRAVKSLTELMRDPAPLVRARAAHALGRIGGMAAAGALYAGLADPDPYVLQVTAEAIAMLGDRHFTSLGRGLRHDSAQVRTTVAKVLAAIGPAALPALQDGLTDRVEVAALCAQVLGDVGSEAVPILCRAAVTEGMPVRRFALESLLRIGDPAAADMYRNLIDARDTSVMGLALQGLAPHARLDDVTRLCAGLTFPAEAVTQISVAALDRLARTSRSAELRAAVPPLTRLIRRQFPGPTRDRLTALLRLIEDATGDRKDLPLPSAADPATLPLPSMPQSADPDSLPLPGESGFQI